MNNLPQDVKKHLHHFGGTKDSVMGFQPKPARTPRIEISNIGCVELIVTRSRDWLQCFWNPETGATRMWGSSKPCAYNRTKRDLIAWVISRN